MRFAVWACVVALAAAGCAGDSPTDPSDDEPGSGGGGIQGRVVVSSDDWVLSDTAFSVLPADAPRFALNLARHLTGGQGRIHAYSDFFAYTGGSLAQTLTGAGYTYTVGIGISFDLATLSGFDALFLGIPLLTSQQVDVVRQYIAAGGHVYIHAGNGISEPDLVPMTWNPLLAPYGFTLQTGFDNLIGVVPVVSTHPLFDGVGAVYFNAGHPISGCCVVATTNGGAGIVAVGGS